MAKKHVDEYFNEIANQYLEMVESLKDIEKEASEGLVDPDRFEMMKQSFEPLKTNYMRISYIMYLLNQPNKKSKQKRYQEQNQKLLHKFKNHTLEDIKKENSNIISNSKGIIK